MQQSRFAPSQQSRDTFCTRATVYPEKLFTLFSTRNVSFQVPGAVSEKNTEALLSLPNLPR